MAAKRCSFDATLNYRSQAIIPGDTSISPNFYLVQM